MLSRNFICFKHLRALFCKIGFLNFIKWKHASDFLLAKLMEVVVEEVKYMFSDSRQLGRK